MVKEMLEKGLSEEFILCFANINKRVLSQGIDTKLNEKARIEPGLIYRERQIIDLNRRLECSQRYLLYKCC